MRSIVHAEGAVDLALEHTMGQKLECKISFRVQLEVEHAAGAAKYCTCRSRFCQGVAPLSDGYLAVHCNWTIVVHVGRTF